MRFREWLLNTELNDVNSGRVFEYAWHSTFYILERLPRIFTCIDISPVIFHKKAVHCPKASECYCEQYGLRSWVIAATVNLRKNPVFVNKCRVVHSRFHFLVLGSDLILLSLCSNTKQDPFPAQLRLAVCIYFLSCVRFHCLRERR